ncbi:MAG: fatty acid--CoA ligase [Chloroflexi bacterium]|nr:fatty acid--CoA ligase [Chloroflexota bacterium]
MIVPLTPLEFEHRAVRLFGDRVGVVDGEKRFTYRAFGERVSRLANAVRGLGIGPGERVAFLAFNCHQLLEAYYGVIAAGAILLPLNVRLSAEEIAAILDHAEACALFLAPEFLPLYQALRSRLEHIRQVVLLEGERPAWFNGHDYETLLARASPERREDPIDENAPAELFYTSGSTGRPKGVVLTHRSLYLHALYAQLAISYRDSDVLLHLVPLFHVNGWGAPHYLTMVGGRHVMLRRFTPAEFCRIVQEERVTRTAGVPTMFTALLAFPDLDRYDLSSLQEIAVGGAPASPALIEALERRLGCRAYSGYGLTETCPVLTLAKPTDVLAATEDQAARIRRQAKTGLPIPGVDLRVVDENGQEVPHDDRTVGEIIVRSNVVMEGYFRDPDGTARAIVNGWFHTGDLAVCDAEGYVTIVDRAKDIIISGGENISSIEVENVLADHPAVFECAVVAVPDPQWGEVPRAFVVPRPGQTVTAEELIAHCRAHLAGFKVPKQIEFRESLPKGGTGKILKEVLRAPFWEGMPRRVH